MPPPPPPPPTQNQPAAASQQPLGSFTTAVGAGTATSLGAASPTTATSSTAAATASASDHVNVRFRLDISPQASPQERQEKIEELSKLLSSLREVAKGRPVVDWDTLVASANPAEGAAQVLQAFQRYPAQLQSNVTAIAARITTPQRLAIVAHMEEPYRSKVRDEVLQGVLRALTASSSPPPPSSQASTAATTASVAPNANPNGGTTTTTAAATTIATVGPVGESAPGSPVGTPAATATAAIVGDQTEAIPLASEMLVEMIRLELVLIKGVATTLDTLLRDRKTRRAATAVIGLLAERYSLSKLNSNNNAAPASAAQAAVDPSSTVVISKAMEEGLLHTINHVRTTLQAVAADAATNGCGELDYDVNAIQRFMGWRNTATQPNLIVAKSFSTNHRCVVATTYFASRDEFVTGGAERTISVWGGPPPSNHHNANPDTTSVASFQLPPHTAPVAMDASVRGNLLAVGCVSTAKAGVPRSSIQAYVCSDSGAWTVGDVIRRPDHTVLTNVRCLAVKGSVVCTTETILGGGGGGGGGEGGPSTSKHQIVLFSATGQETRTFGDAHSDCITALASSPDNDSMLITGGRDTVVRLWDVRSAPSSSAAQTTLLGHSDTITSLVPVRDVLITTSLDGTMKLWDMRRTKTELTQKRFASGIVKAVSTSHMTSVVSTLRGVYLVSLMPNIAVEDVVPNVCFTDMHSNADGTVVFGVNKDVVTSVVVQVKGGSA